MKRVAILVDGGFYRRQIVRLEGELPAAKSADRLVQYCKRHLHEHETTNDLYRIFYYDCPPSAKKVYHPFLKKQIDLGKSDLFEWTNIFLNSLRKKRKVALRLGELSEEQARYMLSYDALKKVCNERLTLNDLTENDFYLDISQKGVDMKIGIDIASLSYKKQVDQIVLISGDSDFVPAAKLARREGIDFILDPMWAPIKDNLNEHIDGLRTKTPRKNIR
ncbi:NYN domain-containing protein [Peptococcus simiae]|uniref:NYN domain-containing protein n=1 Tax=Peptococcus simiae TaxID=1643805 RepID=UPI00398050C8